MRKFEEIRAIAEARKGCSANLEKLIGSGDYPARDPKKMTDDRWLSIFSRHVFAAGFNWKAIDRKWPGFEEAFMGFDVGACAMMDDSWMDALLKDARIVRNGAKIASVRDNAVFLQELAAESGSAAAGHRRLAGRRLRRPSGRAEETREPARRLCRAIRATPRRQVRIHPLFGCRGPARQGRGGEQGSYLPQGHGGGAESFRRLAVGIRPFACGDQPGSRPEHRRLTRFPYRRLSLRGVAKLENSLIG